MAAFVMFAVYMVGRFRAEESLHVVEPGVFAGLLTPDDEIIESSVEQ
jgi:hypothetical protein